MTEFPEALASLPAQLTRSPNLEGRALEPGSRLLVGGLGGSAAPGDFLELLLAEVRPVRVLREAGLPADVREDDQVLVVSFSGETRECLELWGDAAELGLARGAVASGGALLERARHESRPRVMIPGGGAPRTALGSLLRGLALLAGAEEVDWGGAARHLETVREDARAPGGAAESLAETLLGGMPALLSGDAEGHAAARRWAASLAENAKVPLTWWRLPEAAHNRILALGRGAPHRTRVIPVGVGIPRDPDSRRRWEAMLGALAEHGVRPPVIDLPHPEPWIASLGLAYFGDWVSLHLAARLGVDPGPIDLLDDVKRRLASGKESAS